MTILERPKAQALLRDAVLTAEQVEGLAKRIEPTLLPNHRRPRST